MLSPPLWTLSLAVALAPRPDGQIPPSSPECPPGFWPRPPFLAVSLEARGLCICQRLTLSAFSCLAGAFSKTDVGHEGICLPQPIATCGSELGLWPLLLSLGEEGGSSTLTSHHVWPYLDIWTLKQDHHTRLAPAGTVAQHRAASSFSPLPDQTATCGQRLGFSSFTEAGSWRGRCSPAGHNCPGGWVWAAGPWGWDCQLTLASPGTRGNHREGREEEATFAPSLGPRDRAASWVGSERFLVRVSGFPLRNKPSEPGNARLREAVTGPRSPSS